MPRALWSIPAALLTISLAASADTVAPGTEIVVRTNETIELRNWDRGRVYSGQLDRSLRATDGDVVFPRGTQVELIVRQVGDREMVVDLESLLVNGRRYTLAASSPEFNSKDRPGVGGNERTAKYVGGGAIIGSIIGAIAGGGKGAAIGAAAGAATGAGAQTVTRGREIYVPGESILTFRLERPLQYSSAPDNGYTRDNHHYHDYPPDRDHR